MLLLSCCAPCSCAVIEKLARENACFTVYFYNPNIAPAEEYVARRDEQARLCARYGVEFIEGPYEPAVWERAVQGVENAPERGARCERCFALRLRQTARYAAVKGFETFSSVLGVSRYKDLEQVNRVAAEVQTASGVTYDATNWRKGGLEESRRALTKELDLYNQTYCGCIYSRAKESDEKSR